MAFPRTGKAEEPILHRSSLPVQTLRLGTKYDECPKKSRARIWYEAEIRIGRLFQTPSTYQQHSDEDRVNRDVMNDRQKGDRIESGKCRDGNSASEHAKRIRRSSLLVGFSVRFFVGWDERKCINEYHYEDRVERIVRESPHDNRYERSDKTIPVAFRECSFALLCRECRDHNAEDNRYSHGPCPRTCIIRDLRDKCDRADQRPNKVREWMRLRRALPCVSKVWDVTYNADSECQSPEYRVVIEHDLAIDV